MPNPLPAPQLTCVVFCGQDSSENERSIRSVIAASPCIEILAVDPEESLPPALMSHGVISIPVRDIQMFAELFNLALEYVDTQHVAFLKAGDTWLPGASAIYHRALKEFPDAALLESGVLRVQGGRQDLLPLHLQPWMEWGADDVEGYRSGQTVAELSDTLSNSGPLPGYVFQADILKRIRGMNPLLREAGILDLIFRVLNEGRSVRLRANLVTVLSGNHAMGPEFQVSVCQDLRDAQIHLSTEARLTQVEAASRLKGSWEEARASLNPSATYDILMRLASRDVLGGLLHRGTQGTTSSEDLRWWKNYESQWNQRVDSRANEMETGQSPQEVDRGRA